MSLQDFTKFNFLNKKPQKIGIDHFYFMSVIQFDEKYTNTVTSEAVEDGTEISDHIFNLPDTISLSGIVGDNNIFLLNISTELNKIYEPIARLSNYGGTYTDQQLNIIESGVNDAKSGIDYLNSKIEDGQYFASEFGVKKAEDATDKNKEIDTFLLFINGHKKSKQLVEIDTPYVVLENMAITSISLIKNNSSSLTFNITAQNVPVAETLYTDVEKKTKKPSSGIEGQADSKINSGVTQGTSVDSSTKQKVSSLASLWGVQ